MKLGAHVLLNKTVFYYNLLPLRGELTLASSPWLFQYIKFLITLISNPFIALT